jgi:hypothetical protein
MFAAIRLASSSLEQLRGRIVGPAYPSTYRKFRKSVYFIGVGATTGRSDMVLDRIALIGPSVLGLMATITTARAEH